MLTKGDVINEAFSDLRISGLTVIPSPTDTAKALNKLESFMYYLEGRAVCMGYNFEDTPDLNSPHNVPLQFSSMMSSNVAVQLIPAFNKSVPPELKQQANYFLNSAVSWSAMKNLREVPYPNRQPLGSANTLRLFSFQKFYPNKKATPVSCENIVISYSEINDYFQDYSTYLNQSETISSFAITVTDGLIINASANADPRINYTLATKKTAGDNLIRIEITTSTGRVEVRQITVIVISDLIG